MQITHYLTCYHHIPYVKVTVSPIERGSDARTTDKSHSSGDWSSMPNTCAAFYLVCSQLPPCASLHVLSTLNGGTYAERIKSYGRDTSA